METRQKKEGRKERREEEEKKTGFKQCIRQVVVGPGKVDLNES